jgi:phytanoyl-CoA hydroxylase
MSSPAPDGASMLLAEAADRAAHPTRIAEAIAGWRDAGWARIGPALAGDAAAALARRAEEIALGTVQIPGLFFQHDAPTGRYDDLEFGRGWIGPSLRYRKIEKLERDPLFRAWIENPLFEAIARAVIPGEIALYRAVLWTKAAAEPDSAGAGRAGGMALPWHQDGGKFWGLDRDPVLQIWTALDDAPAEAGCVEVVPGSHRGGLATPEGGTIPDSLTAARAGEIVALPARAGEVLLLHNHVWHRSGVNSTSRPRRALSICYMSATTRCTRTRRAPRSFVPVFAEEPAR